MAINKVEANGETLIDLTNDTVTADTLVSGRTAHLASGEKVTGTFEPVTGVKGNAESTYRKGNVNLTPANIGAATSEQGAKADSAVQTIQISGTTQTKTGGTVNLPAYPTKSSLGLGNVDNTSDANKPISTSAQTALNNKADKNGNNITDPTAFRKAIGTGNQVTLTGAVTGTGTFDSNGNIVSVNTTLNSELSGQINYNTNNGVKNLLYTAPITYTARGITISRISPNKYSVSGTTTLSGSTCLMITNLSTAAISADNSQYPASGEYAPGAYIASVYGIPVGLNVQIIAATSVPVSGSNYRALYLNSANPALKFTLAANEKYLWFRIAYNVTSVTTFNDEFEIMLRSATIEDSTFVPYAMSNVELTQKVEDISDCLYIEAYQAETGSYITIDNTADFTLNLFNKYSALDASHRFALLKLSSQTTTQYLRAMINVKLASSGVTINVAFTDGTTLYEFYWYGQSGATGLPRITARTLSFA